jgi:hypothetical protein
MLDKLIVRIIGGIGNQLFSYAAARRLALANQAELVIDDISGFQCDIRYKRQYQLDHFNISSRKATANERLEPFSRFRRFAKRKINQNRRFYNRTYIKQEGVDFIEDILSIKKPRILYLEGYWQSERYFKDVEKIIRDDLIIIPPDDESNIDMSKRIMNSNSVAIHVRFFDEPYAEGINNISSLYYARAINKIQKIVPDAHFFIFSDNPESISSYISLQDINVTYVNQNKGDKYAYADLWLMTMCKHFIIANSTFSWWGAWLANNKNKHVIAPGLVKRDGQSSWGFDGLLPESWLKL